ncbi:SURF1 family protein [Bauldia sp.]|uniref:SURF1 family protein n=1 Tax=Bauldia sp. TaxID=2575872 RepID=UPI003BABCDE8
MEGGTRRLVILGVFALAGFVVLVGLGIWQVQRLQWKEALIARVEAGLAADPVPAPASGSWSGIDVSAIEYQPVIVSGRYLNDREAHVVFTLTQPKGPAGGIGYMVMTPFATDDGWLVYVNRGFVPRENRAPEMRAAGLIDGPTTVTGFLRAPHQRVWFGPADDPEGNAWFSRDPAAFAVAAGLPTDTVAPYIIDAFADPELPGGLPQGGETVVSFSNNHLQYAVTWFGLALALAVVFFAYVVRGRR